MNYLKHYILLIRKSINRNIEQRFLYESHHIFPKSIYGKNDKTVYLTLREHYIAHKLLWKLMRKRYGKFDSKTRKMAIAFHWMVYGKGDTHRLKSTNSYLYESARLAVSESKTGKKREDMKGKSYFGASHETIKKGIEKMRIKKIGMKIEYPKNRKSSPCSIEKANKITESRKNTKEKYISMTKEEFDVWLSKQNYYAKDGRINSNVSRAIKWRNEFVQKNI
jgi:hypothetical protein